MANVKDLTADLRALGVREGDSLLVHSSIKAVGPVENGADTILDALEAAVGRRGLLMLPTHSWDYVNANQPHFYLAESPSCVGMLPEVFRHRPDAFRSWHPTHSVAAWGEDAWAVLEGHETFDTPAAWDSPYGRLAQRRGYVLILGARLTNNTFLHGVEEWCRVPGRLTEEMEMLYTHLPDGRCIPVPSHRHIGHVSERYGKIRQALLDTGIGWQGKVGMADCWLLRAEPMARLVTGLLAKDPDLFGHDGPVDPADYRDFRP